MRQNGISPPLVQPYYKLYLPPSFYATMIVALVVQRDLGDPTSTGHFVLVSRPPASGKTPLSPSDSWFIRSLLILLTLAFLMRQDYIVIHETKGKCKSTGSSKATSGNPVGERFGHSRSSPAGRSIAILCETLEGGDRERRKRSVDGEASPRPAFPLVSRTERGTSGITSRRASGSWVCKSIVDTATDSQGNRGSFWCKVSSGPCLEDSPRLWLELPKATAVG